jgi:hypothetical protein
MSRILSIIIVCGVLSACATNPHVEFGEYYPRLNFNHEIIAAEINERNTTLEQHPAWKSMAAGRFMIKQLPDINPEEYSNYRKYLDDGDLYVIVHPAYSVFFHDLQPYLPGNPVDSFVSETTYTDASRFSREQERSLRDFIEITSTRKRLILLVLPGNYQEYGGYYYRDKTDLYARYVNSVTNNSESVLYLYSEKPNRGKLSAKSKEQLTNFFESVNPERIIIGGGYLGRCISDFYKNISSSGFGEKMMVAGEISAFSRDDMNRLNVGDFLNDGKLNIEVLKEVVSSAGLKGISFKEILKNYNNYRNNRG